MNTIRIQRYHAPCGDLMLGSFESKLCLCDWIPEKRRASAGKRVRQALEAVYEEGTSELIERAAAQLDAYFARRRQTFDIPLLFTGTAFQNSVWRELLDIPYGETISYGELSARLGNPKAVRAVAAANGANPISIFVPCHRVIGCNRKLVGYGGGLDVKRDLLELETDSQGLLY